MRQSTTPNGDRARAALRVEVERVLALLRSVRHASAPALGVWDLAEVALHLSQGRLAVPGLANRDLADAYAVLPELDVVGGHGLVRADGRRWPIEPAHPAMAVEGFLVPVLGALDPRAMVHQAAAEGLGLTYELRIRGGGRHVFAFGSGVLTVGPGRRRAG